MKTKFLSSFLLLAQLILSSGAFADDFVKLTLVIDPDCEEIFLEFQDEDEKIRVNENKVSTVWFYDRCDNFVKRHDEIECEGVVRYKVSISKTMKEVREIVFRRKENILHTFEKFVDHKYRKGHWRYRTVECDEYDGFLGWLFGFKKEVEVRKKVLCNWNRKSFEERREYAAYLVGILKAIND